LYTVGDLPLAFSDSLAIATSLRSAPSAVTDSLSITNSLPVVNQLVVSDRFAGSAPVAVALLRPLPSPGRFPPDECRDSIRGAIGLGSVKVWVIKSNDKGAKRKRMNILTENAMYLDEEPERTGKINL
jgi:hypothetical protein